MPAKRHEHAEAAGPGRRPDRGFADLHVHTAASDGSASVRETLRTAEHIGWLDLIAITDHDTVRGAVEARRIAAGEGLRIDVAIGEEITTRGGHVLGLFLEDRVEPGRSVADTIRAVHDQGGLAIPAHPVFPYRACVSAREIRAAAEDVRSRPDGLEAHNPTALGRLVRRRVVRLAAALNLAVVGGSDSHRPERIGRAWTAFRRSEARACEDLRAAIASRATESGGVDDPLVQGIPLFASQVFHGMMSRIHPRDRRA